VITADGGYRGGKIVSAEATTDGRAQRPRRQDRSGPKRTARKCRSSGRDKWWHDVVRRGPAGGAAPEERTAEDRSYHLHLGVNGKAKGA